MNFISDIKIKQSNARSLYSNMMLIALSSLALTSCANMKNNPIYDSGMVIYDPMEEQNRKIMAFNQAVDHAFINPIIKGYRAITPRPARSGIRNFLHNIKSPITLANQLLQGDIKGAWNVILRTTINTSIGIGGIFDVAGYEGIKYEQEDFGQTLAVWGVGHGPYMVLPFIGPSSLRDYGGYLTDYIADPLRMYAFNTDHELLYAGKFMVEYLDLRDSLINTLTDLEENSIDFYAAVRSAYYQHRKALVNDQESTAQSSIPAIPYYEDDD